MTSWVMAFPRKMTRISRIHARESDARHMEIAE